MFSVLLPQRVPLIEIYLSGSRSQPQFLLTYDLHFSLEELMKALFCRLKKNAYHNIDDTHFQGERARSHQVRWPNICDWCVPDFLRDITRSSYLCHIFFFFLFSSRDGLRAPAPLKAEQAERRRVSELASGSKIGEYDTCDMKVNDDIKVRLIIVEAICQSTISR